MITYLFTNFTFSNKNKKIYKGKQNNGTTFLMIMVNRTKRHAIFYKNKLEHFTWIKVTKIKSS